MSTLAELTELKTAYMKRIEDEGEAILKKAFTEFFAAHPDCEAIRWTQYAPYFNDGEPCEFSVHEFEYKFAAGDEAASEEADSEEDEENEDDDDYEEWQITEAQAEFCGEFEGQFSDHEDMLKLVFGDDTRVTATREGFECDEYSHD